MSTVTGELQDADGRSRWRQDRRRVRKSLAAEPGRSDRGGAPRGSFARPCPVGGRAHQHSLAVCWRREDHSPEDPDHVVAGEPTDQTRICSKSSAYGRFREWARAGVFEALWTQFLADPQTTLEWTGWRSTRRSSRPRRVVRRAGLIPLTPCTGQEHTVPSCSPRTSMAEVDEQQRAAQSNACSVTEREGISDA